MIVQVFNSVSGKWEEQIRFQGRSVLSHFDPNPEPMSSDVRMPDLMVGEHKVVYDPKLDR